MRTTLYISKAYIIKTSNIELTMIDDDETLKLLRKTPDELY